MVAEVFAGIGALKAAFDIAKGLKDIDDAARRNAAVIELQEKILSAQSAQSDLVQRIRELRLRARNRRKTGFRAKPVHSGQDRVYSKSLRFFGSRSAVYRVCWSFLLV